MDGRWYTADLNRKGQFLQEWKEDGPGAAPTSDDRAKKLEMLEQRLLEGKISEETFERLRRKYEGL